MKIKLKLLGFEWLFLYETLYQQYSQIQDFKSLSNTVLYEFMSKVNLIDIKIKYSLKEKEIDKKSFKLSEAAFLYEFFTFYPEEDEYRIEIIRKILGQIEPQLIALTSSTPYHIFSNLKAKQDGTKAITNQERKQLED